MAVISDAEFFQDRFDKANIWAIRSLPRVPRKTGPATKDMIKYKGQVLTNEPFERAGVSKLIPKRLCGV
jgi:hypothetical protein